MGLHTAFTALAAVVDAYESRGQTIRSVEASQAPSGDAVVDVTLTMPVALSADESSSHRPESATVTECGGIQVQFSTSVTDPPSPDGVAVTTTERRATVTDDGLVLTLGLTVDASGEQCSSAGADTAAVDGDGATDRLSRPADTESSGRPRADSESQRRPEPMAEREESSEGGETDTATDDITDTATDDVTDATTDLTAETDETAGDTASEPELNRFAAVRDDAVPPYEDTAYLQVLYDECDNFTEIAEEIQMDVSSETVRRYMIDADIHVPNSYNTASDDDQSASGDAASAATAPDDQEPGLSADTADPATAESAGAADGPGEGLPDEQLVTDGIGLPEEVRLCDVADAVVESDTVYEVQRTLGLDRDRTRDLLSELNLLDLVLCRVSDKSGSGASYDAVASRIRQCTPSTA